MEAQVNDKRQFATIADTTTPTSWVVPVRRTLFVAIYSPTSLGANVCSCREEAAPLVEAHFHDGYCTILTTDAATTADYVFGK
jgi:hypothetical protein